MSVKQKIRVVNASTVVDASDFELMIHACREQLTVAAGLWGRSVPTLSSAHATTPDDSTTLQQNEQQLAADGEWVIVLIDDADQAGDLGWHTEDAGAVFGFIFAKPSLASGSTALSGEYAVSAVLSHELLETLIDPDINSWWQVSPNELVAAEVCDPVEGSSYATLDGVALSNFVWPAWGDVNAAAGSHHDYAGRCSSPFEVLPQGYVVVWDTRTNKVSQAFGEHFPPERVAVKDEPSARNAIRRARLASDDEPLPPEHVGSVPADGVDFDHSASST